MKHLNKFESYKSKEEMYNYLYKVCGYKISELESMSDSEIEEICNEKEAEMTSEKKGEKWIQDAIKRPGSLRKEMGKGLGEKITKSEISDELSKLKKKDKDKSKPGIQGLSKSDLKKFRQLNLAKTLKSMKESGNTDNYMFFSNLNHICRMVSEILEMDHLEIDRMLTEEHDWAADHISKSKESISHVYHWLKSTENE
jgi:hypothetical protein